MASGSRRGCRATIAALVASAIGGILFGVINNTNPTAGSYVGILVFIAILLVAVIFYAKPIRSRQKIMVAK